jgi:hypothetical protein
LAASAALLRVKLGVRVGSRLVDPRTLNNSQPALARRMHAGKASANTIAETFGVSRATAYRVLAEHDDEDE